MNENRCFDVYEKAVYSNLTDNERNGQKLVSCEIIVVMDTERESFGDYQSDEAWYQNDYNIIEYTKICTLSIDNLNKINYLLRKLAIKEAMRH